MKHFILTAAALLSASASLGATEVLTSPDGRLQLSFDLTADGTPTYKMDYNNKPVIATSRLGLELKNQKSTTTRWLYACRNPTTTGICAR